jgi:glucose/arabinose dehydrogenase
MWALCPDRERPVSMMRFLGGLVVAISLAAGSVQAAEPYRTQGDCDGFPRVDLKTAPDLCVGLVARHLGFARGVAMIGRDVYVVDMGGWHRARGRLLRLGDGGRGPPEPVLSGLDEPNGLALAPDGGLYIGVLGKIVRVDPAAPDPAATAREIVTGLPGDGLHPLSALAVAPDGSLFVNVGSATDHCEGAKDAAPDPAAACPETLGAPPHGVILHVVPASTPVDAHGIAPYARGLRNSMALAMSASGRLLAGVNARDYIDRADPALSDEDLPHDTFDVVEEGADYGWPYCYDEDVPSPEYPKYDCRAKRRPTLLLPPHAAPLGMLIYRGGALPGLDQRLVIGFHGYRALGHRIVALPVDGDGKPTGPLRDIVWGWDDVDGDHPQGAPVSLFEADDGSILVTEDHNGTLLRLARLRAR